MTEFFKKHGPLVALLVLVLATAILIVAAYLQNDYQSESQNVPEIRSKPVTPSKPNKYSASRRSMDNFERFIFI